MTPTEVVERLAAATNAHDLEAIVSCFATDYENITPVHPERSFTGRDQVRRNWSQILGAIGDVSTEVLQISGTGDTVWSEWEHRGTRPDGSAHLMRGVIIFTVRDDVIARARFYLEPVQQAVEGIDDVVRRQTTGGGR